MQENLTAAEDKSPVIVFACGRTGSTLLIRMLNCLPRTIVWGEHNGALRPLLSSYSRLRDVANNKFFTRAASLLQPVYDREPVLSGKGMSIEWLNWFSAADIDRLYREMITGLFYPDSLRGRFSRWGFKEIQYRDSEDAILRTLFPSMKAISCTEILQRYLRASSGTLPSMMTSACRRSKGMSNGFFSLLLNRQNEKIKPKTVRCS